MLNVFCVVFKSPPSDPQIGSLKATCSKVEQIFPHAFQVEFDGSFSSFRFCMKTDFNADDYYLIVPKKMLLHVNRADVDAASS